MNFFYIRNKKQFPIACVATKQLIDGPGEHLVYFAWAVWSPNDEFTKERGRFIAAGRLNMLLKEFTKTIESRIACATTQSEAEEISNDLVLEELFDVLGAVSNMPDVQKNILECIVNTPDNHEAHMGTVAILGGKPKYCSGTLADIPGSLRKAAKFQLKLLAAREAFDANRLESPRVPVHAAICERNVPVGHAEVGTDGSVDNGDKKQVYHSSAS